VVRAHPQPRVGPRPAIALAVLAVTAGGGAAAIAGSDRAVEPADHAAVERTVRAAVYAAVRHGNHRRACRFATPRGRRRLLEGFNSSSGPDYPDCPTIIADEVENYPETVRRLRRDLQVEVLRVGAGRARVRVADGTGPFAGRGHLALVRAEGRWRIDNSDLIPYGD
jgi:hypothetical protein